MCPHEISLSSRMPRKESPYGFLRLHGCFYSEASWGFYDLCWEDGAFLQGVNANPGTAKSKAWPRSTSSRRDLRSGSYPHEETVTVVWGCYIVQTRTRQAHLGKMNTRVIAGGEEHHGSLGCWNRQCTVGPAECQEQCSFGMEPTLKDTPVYL